MLKYYRQYRNKPQIRFDGWKGEKKTPENSESSICLSFQTDQKTAWLQHVRTFMGSKYQLLNGSLIWQRKAHQELVAGSEAKFKWEIRHRLL